MYCPYVNRDFDNKYIYKGLVIVLSDDLEEKYTLGVVDNKVSPLKIFLFCKINAKVYSCLKCFYKEEHKNCSTYKMQVFSEECRKFEEEAIQDGK